jgi:phosphotransferase system enzyme I (PtsI)
MKGIKVYEGIGVGKAFVLKSEVISDNVRKEAIDISLIENEKEAFKQSLQKTIEKIEGLKKHAEETVGKEESMIFDAHLEMVQDITLLDSIEKKIEDKKYHAEQAVLEARDEIVKVFMAIDDEYLKARAKDVIDVTDMLINTILGIEVNTLSSINEPTILFAQDLKPSETILLNDYVVGIVLEEGSVTSHAAIVAKAKGIPTVVGIENATEEIENGIFILLDATEGVVIINPDENTNKEYKDKIEAEKKEKERLLKTKDKPGRTKDGHTVRILGNVGSLQETKWVKENGGFGIGLLRTELIYMNSDHFPTEEEQFKYYKEIVETLPGEIIIRTLDIGGDKMLPYYKFPEEMNPFLGFRAIRFCLKNEELFKSQLKAILRAGNYGNVKIMLPMVSAIEEIRESKVVLEKAKEELRAENKSFKEDIPLGIMIEIPAAAVAADIFAKEVDFFSIGTNDLCQYTSAVDRMNKEVAYLYQPYHPSILRLIKMTIEGAKNNNIEVGVCGETAGDPDYALLLTGLGIDELSMSASMIPKVKDRMFNYTKEELEKLAEKVLQASTAEEAKKILFGGKKC